MSFEYNGVVYRDLEPQVRYDAEQIQLLKQADVTINENLQTVNESLQTVNTEVNGKLTKPANPTAESAVTMLADGTVGTKLLSEIGGGGGGKLYLHNLTCSITDTEKAYLVLYTSGYSNTFDLTSLKTFLTEHVNALKNTIGMYRTDNGPLSLFSSISVMGSSLTGYKYEMNGSPAIKDIISVTDIAVEL